MGEWDPRTFTNELSRWRGVAVDVRDPDPSASEWSKCGNRINRDNYNTVWVHDNYIHHNLHNRSEGYGVAVYESAYALIEKNVFDYNRHAIASSGDPGTGYYAERNLVLRNGGLNNDTWHVNTHMFDVHGTESCCGRELYCGPAGERFEFRYNTILYTAGTAIKVRGRPLEGAIADHNVFTHSDEGDICWFDGAMVQNDPGGNLDSQNNLFDADFDDMLVHPMCDFNGDGANDDFLATGATWWFRSGASNGDWRYLNTSFKRWHQLTFGYFSGDGLCDVKDNQGRVYLGGVALDPSLPVVPNVKELGLAEASSVLAAAGFTKGTVDGFYDKGCSYIRGEVVSQSPAAGTYAPAGTPVNLSIALRPPVCP